MSGFRRRAESVGLAPPPGGPHDPGMEARVAKLETDVTDMKAILVRLDARSQKLETDIQRMLIDVAELKGRVSQLPGTLQLLGFVLAVLGIAGLVRVFA
jgi:hypothetical protein